MRVIVIGLGSMGRRRIRLLKNNIPSIEIAGMDLNSERRKLVENEFKIITYQSLEEAIEKFNPIASIISTSPLSHAKIILKCLDNNLHVFTEINLVDFGYDEIIKKAKNKNKELFLSSTMIYRKEIEFIEKEVSKSKKKFNYRYHVGQYLPDWHPWENYKEFFVGQKETNGCRELMGIELPWIIKTFGKIKYLNTQKFKITSLDLDYPDIINIMLEHENGNSGVLTFDIVSRKAIRSLEIISEDNHIFWEGTPSSLEIYNLDSKSLKHVETYDEIIKDKNYASNIIENVYLEELKIYLDKINNKKNLERYTFEDDKYVIKIMNEIEGV